MSGWTLAGTTILSATAGALAGYIAQRATAAAQARVDYTANAKRRLYEAIGPLRFQLLVACRDVERRLSLHLQDRWNLSPDQYYGRSFIYRLLRPLAIGILVERQMSYADFSVDSSSIDLLRFETAAYRMLSGKDPLPYHSGLDFATQSQHVFRDNLRTAASTLLTTGVEGRPVVMDYAQFSDRYPDPRRESKLAALAEILGTAGENLSSKPVVWVRLVSYAYLCERYLERHGAALGFGSRPFDVRYHLAAANDPQIQRNLASYPKLLDDIIDERHTTQHARPHVERH